MVKSYKDLLVWQKSVDLVAEIYKITELFPKSELYGIISQMRRASVSIPANIAEGASRGYRKEYYQFVRMAYASVAELETHIIVAKKLGFLSDERCQLIDPLLDEIMRMAQALSRSLVTRNS